MRKLLSKFRYQLADQQALLSYSLLGVVGGVASGLVVLAFELAIFELGALWGVGNKGEQFETLPQWMLFALPAGGATLLGIAYSLLQPADRETGIVHVISRMHSHYSVLPLRNAAVQFIGGTFALASGQSGGREGPGVHLGGAANSLLGQWLGLPHNSLRVLVACGTAGGIAAVFHTPMAGVIFAMEVIVAEYTVIGFIPVLLAAVSATAVSRALSPDSVLFSLPTIQMSSMLELPFIMLLGLVCGVAASAFIGLSALAARLAHWPVALRFAFAGCITGGLALLVPQILGMGYDTLDLTLQGELALATLAAIALCKILATALSCGVGMPIGLIGPNLVIGACIGAIFGSAATAVQPELASDATLYIVIGMAAAMGAVLNAPLAALLAVVELTQTISIGMPAMLAIVTASLTNSGIFGQESAHRSVLRQLQRLVPVDPINQLLHRANVTRTMDTRVVRVPALLRAEDLEPLLESTPAWCVVTRGDDDLYLVDGAELIASLAQMPLAEQDADLTETGIRRWTIAPISIQASLREAMDTMRDTTSEAVCIYERSRSSGKNILHGIITKEAIEKFTLSSLG